MKSERSMSITMRSPSLGLVSGAAGIAGARLAIALAAISGPDDHHVGRSCCCGDDPYFYGGVR
jgi:hypothetical protein